MIKIEQYSYMDKLLSMIFYRIDFSQPGEYARGVYLFYNNYKRDYYEKMMDGWKMHSLSNYGIITVWYFKPHNNGRD